MTKSHAAKPVHPAARLAFLHAYCFSCDRWIEKEHVMSHEHRGHRVLEGVTQEFVWSIRRSEALGWARSYE